MNIPNLTALAAYLRTVNEDHFDIADWFQSGNRRLDDQRKASEVIHACGTTACIAGHAVVLFEPNMPMSQMKPSYVSNTAQRHLGLNYQERDQLFMGGVMRRPTANQAADVIDNLIQTGKVDWSLVPMPEDDDD